MKLLLYPLIFILATTFIIAEDHCPLLARHRGNLQADIHISIFVKVQALL